MKKVLITRRLIRESEDKASKLFDAKFNTNDELYSQKKIIEMSEGFDGILSSLTEKLDAETINQLPDSVKIISNFAVGFGNIDLEAAKNRGIAVTNTPEVLSDATAEIGILLILGACRRDGCMPLASIPLIICSVVVYFERLTLALKWRTLPVFLSRNCTVIR